jgi:hypothetical protein
MVMKLTDGWGNCNAGKLTERDFVSHGASDWRELGWEKFSCAILGR